MRGLSEIAFRIRQEMQNAMLLLRKPGIGESLVRVEGLPGSEAAFERLRGTRFAREIESRANGVLSGRMEILGYEIAAGPELDWRRDYVHGMSTGTEYSRFIPFLDFKSTGDHKVVWELNRHQHLVLLAQALRLTNRKEYLDRIIHDLSSWFAANPYCRGINWTSALEVAFRALSWTWVCHFVGDWLTPEFRRQLGDHLYRHGCFIESNLSVYFSPNTHLLGEGVALCALGTLLPALPRARTWERIGRRIVSEQLERQVREDGSHFEQSSYYHVYALDMLLFHYVTAGRPKSLVPRLVKMAEYLNALMGPGRALPFFGDDDGGRFFHPYGERALFGRATLATSSILFGRPDWGCDRADVCEQAAWWLGEEAWQAAMSARSTATSSHMFPDAGIAVMESGATHIVADAGCYGSGSAGHSHSDALSLVVRRGGEEILVDSGTFTYTADRLWRNWFRGSSAHNTIRVDGRDQAAPTKTFGWGGRPEVKALQWIHDSDCDLLDASCRHDNFQLRRRILFVKPDLLIILDQVDGPPGEHMVEQFWHFGSPESWRLKTSKAGILENGGEHGWRSTVYGRKQAATVLRVASRIGLPVTLAAAVDLAPEPVVEGIAEAPGGRGLAVRVFGSRPMLVEFGDSGLPLIKAADVPQRARE